MSEDISRASALSRFLRCRVIIVATAADPQGDWQQRRALERLISPLPDEAFAAILARPAGYVALTAEATGYLPGPTEVDGIMRAAVVRVHHDDLCTNPQTVLRAFARLIDHLLGSGLEPGGAILSGPLPVATVWDDVGRRLGNAFAAGYAPRAEADTPASYLEWLIAQYILTGRDLSIIDPAGYALMRSTLFDSGFWRGHPIASNSGIVC